MCASIPSAYRSALPGESWGSGVPAGGISQSLVQCRFFSAGNDMIWLSELLCDKEPEGFTAAYVFAAATDRRRFSDDVSGVDSVEVKRLRRGFLCLPPALAEMPCIVSAGERDPGEAQSVGRTSGST